MKPETKFRTYTVLPFLKTLRRTAFFPIQQKAIHGDADYILCSYGLFVWLELKKEGGTLRPLQELKANNVRRIGRGIALEASPENWEEAKQALLFLDERDETWDKRLYLRCAHFYSILHSGKSSRRRLRVTTKQDIG